MELYIPPPSTFLPRLPPPRPVVPAVPIVPVPDLPDTIYAPEGAYTKETKLFPSIGTPTPPITYDPRPMAPAASFIGGAGGFIVPVPGQPGQPTGQTALSFGSTVVNGQTQPAWPVRMSWVTVYFPAKTGVEKQSGFGGLLGMGNTAGGASGTGNQPPQPPPMSGYEPSVSSDDSSPTSSDNPPPPIPIEVPLSALPQQGKRMPFIKTAIPSGLPRPKNNLRSSSSTFVTRLQALDSLPKIMAEKGRGGPETVRWGFWNLGRTLGWGEEGGKVKDALARVTFSQVPTCHAISHFTAGPDRVDLVVGFSSGDLVWLDFVIGKYTRINKGGLLNNTAVISVKFDPRHPHYFISTFADGTVLKFNLFAEDPVATTIDLKNMPWNTYFDRQMGISEPGTPGPGDLASKSHKKMQNGLKDNVDENSMLIWKNDEFGNLAELTKKLNKGEERKPWAGRNPMGAMKLGKSAINALAYSPDARTLAVVSEDGALRLVDVEDQRLTDTFAGYFGALNCVAWSPDSRFLVVGGQDDLITIYSPREGRVVARCQGHSAFVTAIKFDSSRGGGYRFGSVGEDGKLVLWDFTAAQLHRPRHHHPSNSSHHRLAAGSSLSLANQAQAQAEVNKAGGRYHPAPPRSEVALLQPVMARVIEGNLLTSIYFTPSAIYTISRAALVKVWQRPPRQSSAANKRNMLKTLAQKPNEELRSPRGRDSMLVA